MTTVETSCNLSYKNTLEQKMRSASQSSKPVAIRTTNNQEEKRTVMGLHWGKRGHIVAKYSELKASRCRSFLFIKRSQDVHRFVIKSSDLVEIPLSVHAIDKDMNIVVLKQNANQHLTPEMQSPLSTLSMTSPITTEG